MSTPTPEISEPVHLTWFAGPARYSTSGTFRAWSWEEFADKLQRPALWPGGGSVEYARLQLGGWSFARYRDDSRVPPPGEPPSEDPDERVVGVYGLAVEYDADASIDAAEIQRRWGGVRFVAHTTAHHLQPKHDRPPGPRWRVLIPFQQPVGPVEARLVGRWARHPRRQAGLVSESTERPSRWYAEPAQAPRDYLHLVHGDAPLLDPAAALKELRAWTEEEREREARDLLRGTGIGEAWSRHLRRIEDSRQADARFPWPLQELDELAGVLRVGRIVQLVAPRRWSGSALAVQTAWEACRSGHPVLHVATALAEDELLARFGAQLSTELSWKELREGSVTPEAVARLGESLTTACPELHLWVPRLDRRNEDALRLELQAMVDAARGRPPLLVVDHGMRWHDGGDRELALRTLLGFLREVAPAEGDWPGCAAVVLGESSDAWLDADLLLRLEGEGRRARLEVHDPDGPLGALQLIYDPHRGRFTVG